MISTMVTWVVGPIEVVTLMLSILAVCLGAWSLIKRSREVTLAVCCFLAGIASMGVALSKWQVTRISHILLDQTPIDSLLLLNQFTYSAYPATYVLFGCGLGFCMSGLACIFPKKCDDLQNPQAEPPGSAQPATKPAVKAPVGVQHPTPKSKDKPW